MLTPAALRPKLDALVLPVPVDQNGDLIPIEDATDIYKPIIKELGVHSKQEFNLLRRMIAEKLDSMRQERITEIMERIKNGEEVNYDEIPTFPDGDSIPEDMIPLFTFMAWVNEKVDRD